MQRMPTEQREGGARSSGALSPFCHVTSKRYRPVAATNCPTERGDPRTDRISWIATDIMHSDRWHA